MIEALKTAIKEAEQNGSLFRTETSRGFSGDSIIGSLQRFCSLYSALKNTCYLEIGVFQGLTLLSVAHDCRDIPCFGIDNFSLDPHQENLSIVDQGIAKLKLSNAKIINKDYEDALENLKDEIGCNKVAVYFIDGPHDYRSQFMCLQLALPYLHENAVIVVDDSNYRHVRQANRDFLLTNPEWKLLFEAYTPFHPDNMAKEGRSQALTGWWDGVNILVRDKENRLDPIYPPTERSRLLFENEHFIQSARIAEMVPEAVFFTQSIFNINLCRIFQSFFRLVVHLIKQRRMFRSRFKWNNTYSDTLPRSHFNTPRS